MRSLTALTTANITNTANGIITVNAGGTPGFCHIKVTETDETVTQTQVDGLWWGILGRRRSRRVRNLCP